MFELHGLFIYMSYFWSSNDNIQRSSGEKAGHTACVEVGSSTPIVIPNSFQNLYII